MLSGLSFSEGSKSSPFSVLLTVSAEFLGAGSFGTNTGSYADD